MEINTPVIPEVITVHLGAPGEKAKNITVPFTEYIKNVASNEIYPTWPTDAIKANVLAQISFALNRVYNEWYPSQGYDFDITSNPKYDQTFKENSQFYDPIVTIVDDIFNNYIARTDSVQPLYAQYCDGKTVTCNGLSQWGSVRLAKDGLNPLEILSYYYGNNIKLIYNAPISDNIVSYPGVPIKLGAAGNYVRILKIQLNRIRKNYPALPLITNETPFFTVDMETSVKKFQEIFNLPVTGIVDKATWYKIKYIYNSVKQVANLYSEGISEDEAELAFKSVIKKGDSGNEVDTLNYLISIIAYIDPDIPFLETGHNFSDNTEQMVKAFQKKYNLEETGEVDQKTWVAIITAYRNIISHIPSELLIYQDEFFPGYTVSKGMTGANVIRVQRFLLIICNKTHSIPGIKVTGNFDDLTEQSVKAIQQQEGLPVNGVVDPVTWYRIVELSKKR